jgi:hypothetical protein
MHADEFRKVQVLDPYSEQTWLQFDCEPKVQLANG